MLLVMPSDHAMTDVSAFLDAIAATAPTVEDGALALFGIAPARPATGYGYIAAGDLLADRPGVRTVRRFVEKPGPEQDASMLADGVCSRSPGILLLRADSLPDDTPRTHNTSKQEEG